MMTKDVLRHIEKAIMEQTAQRLGTPERKKAPIKRRQLAYS
jgi:hypothetical protein